MPEELESRSGDTAPLLAGQNCALIVRLVHTQVERTRRVGRFEKLRLGLGQVDHAVRDHDMAVLRGLTGSRCFRGPHVGHDEVAVVGELDGGNGYPDFGVE